MRRSAAVVFAPVLVLLVGFARGGVAPKDTPDYHKVVALESKLATMSVRSDHPRIYLNAENLAAYQARMPTHPAWLKIKADADGGDMLSAAFCYQMLKASDSGAAANYANKAVTAILAKAGKRAERALAFDWVYEKMTDAQRATAVGNLERTEDARIPWYDLDLTVAPTPPGAPWVLHSEEWCGSI